MKCYTKYRTGVWRKVKIIAYDNSKYVTVKDVDGSTFVCKACYLSLRRGYEYGYEPTREQLRARFCAKAARPRVPRFEKVGRDFWTFHYYERGWLVCETMTTDGVALILVHILKHRRQARVHARRT